MTEEAMTEDLKSRLVSLEHWRTQMEVAFGRSEERWIGLQNRLDSIEKDISGIQDLLRWLNRLVIGGIMAGAIAFLLRGGLSGIG